MRVFSFQGGKGARGGAPKCQIQIVLLSDLAIEMYWSTESPQDTFLYIFGALRPRG